MDRSPNSTEEAAESVNPGDQGLRASDPAESIRSESHAPVEPNESLLRIYHDMARVLERLTAPIGPIDMVRRHGCKTRENSNFLKKGKMVISVKTQNFSRYWMMKWTSPLESSLEI